MAEQAWSRYLMAVLAALTVSGCATTRHDSYTTVPGMGEIEQQQPSPTANMNAMEKTGYYLGWFSLDLLYSWAGDHDLYWPQ